MLGVYKIPKDIQRPNTITKTELIEKMATDAGISKAAAGKALESFIGGVTQALKKKGGKVTLIGFGTFSKTRRKARKGRNSQTGETIFSSYSLLEAIFNGKP